MRTILLGMIFLCLAKQINAQENIVDSLQRKINFLEQRLDEKNYTRVPAEDLEKLLDNKVSAEVYNSIYKWIGFLGALIALVGFLISAYSRSLIKETVEKEAEKKYNTLQTQLDNSKNELQKENYLQDEKLKQLHQEFEKFAEAQQHFRVETARLIDEKVTASFKTLNNNVAESILQRADASAYNSPSVISEIEEFLENKNIVIPVKTRIKMIDTLVRCYYSTQNLSPEINKYKKMIEIVNRYEKEYDLFPETFVNAAIALSNQYEYYGVKSDRDACLEACDKSIVRLQDYGTAYAVKLEVYAMDYKKAFNESEKEEAKMNLKRVFASINNNQSKHICKEVNERFNLDYKISYLNPYIVVLDTDFTAEMLAIKQRAEPAPEQNKEDNG
ncbi:MAG: hypothetical protein KGZ74_12520 [Chitinophagaceae bacterium]|nr:hypothetical protein [Chitinophagaceae bacterium]